MSQPEPLTEQQLDEIETRAAHLHEYACQDDGEGDTLAGTDVPLLLAEVRRQRAELAAAVALHEKGEHNGLAICLHCAQQMYPPPETGIWSESAYPCATLQALGVGEERPAVASAAGQSGRIL